MGGKGGGGSIEPSLDVLDFGNLINRPKKDHLTLTYKSITLGGQLPSSASKSINMC